MFQYEHVPEKYDEIYNKITCQGARVLALGYKKLGEMAAKDVGSFCSLYWLFEIYSLAIFGR